MSNPGRGDDRNALPPVRMSRDEIRSTGLANRSETRSTVVHFRDGDHLGYVLYVNHKYRC